MHVLMPLETCSVMFPKSLGVSGLSTSYTLLQVTKPGYVRPRLVFRWLTSYPDSTGFSLSWAPTILMPSLLFLFPLIPKYLRALANEWATKPLQPTSTGKDLALHPAHCSCWSELPFKGFFQAVLHDLEAHHRLPGWGIWWDDAQLSYRFPLNCFLSQ